MRLQKIQLFLIILIAGLIGYSIGVFKINLDWKAYHPHVQIINKEPPASLSTVDLSQFWNVWDKINTMYYDKSVLDPQKMLNGAIEGLVSSLGDPFTMYLPPTQNTNFKQQLAGEFDGIGAELGTQNGNIIVIAPLEGSPAQKAGVLAGDTIVSIDNKTIQGLALSQVVDKIRGPKGTQVTLGIVHKNATSVTQIPITRDVITVKSVFGWVKPISKIDAISDTLKQQHPDTNIMYIQLSQFGDSTNQDWTAMIQNLQQQSLTAKGLVLDLRNNPGGFLSDATYIAGEFLKQGTPVVIQDDGTNNKITLSVTRQGSLLTIPMVVLINGGSASASEIVSGALRDNGRAKLVGDKSFGKGTIQQALDLGQGAGLHVTIAKWLTPNGTWVHGKGLTPDYPVSLDPKDLSHDTQLEKAIDVLLQQ